MGDLFMFKDNSGPLMYINSVQTPNNQKFGQQVYDSRNPIKIKSKELGEEKNSDSLEGEKNKEIQLSNEELNLLMKIIDLKMRDSSVKCEFYANNKVFVGVPISLNEGILVIENEGVVEEIDLFEVTKIFIV